MIWSPKVYHRTSHMDQNDQRLPSYAQLYIVDTEQATDIRMARKENEKLKREILMEIDDFFRSHNVIAKSYKMMTEVMNQQTRQAQSNGHQIPNVGLAFRKSRKDQRRYNTPTANEVAMVFCNEDGEPPFERDIVIYRRNPKPQQSNMLNIKVTNPNLDPMTYALIWPYGEAGWEPKMETEHYINPRDRGLKRVEVTNLQWRGAQLSIRDEFNPVLHSGKLSQQLFVDMYTQVEATRLQFIRCNQKKLRQDKYEGLMDYLQNRNDIAGTVVGQPVILPSSFEGSPRNMHERCADAMSIFAKKG